MHSRFFSLAFATLASGHGIITSPTARSAGTAMKAVCGQQVTENLQSNEYGDIQQLMQISASQKDFDPASCDVSLCKGLKFDDNTANIQNFTAGQVVPIKIEIQAKHTGTANVSIVDTASNTMISQQLVFFPVYASTATDIPKNQTQFNITMPDVSSQCVTAGACVVQVSCSVLPSYTELPDDVARSGGGTQENQIRRTSAASTLQCKECGESVKDRCRRAHHFEGPLLVNICNFHHVLAVLYVGVKTAVMAGEEIPEVLFCLLLFRRVFAFQGDETRLIVGQQMLKILEGSSYFKNN
jgi:hypothetical protein